VVQVDCQTLRAFLEDLKALEVLLGEDSTWPAYSQV
jgi:hypothetical protein